MARSQNDSRGNAPPGEGADAAATDLEARVDSLETALETIAAEGIKARLESPDLVAELMATHGLDELATKVANLESVFNAFEGTEKPDLMMRLQDMDGRIDALDQKTEETVLTVARGLSELRAVLRDLTEQLALETNAGSEE